MKILVVGGGGREHAIVMKLAESSQVEALYCAPGNGGIAKYAKCFPVKATDIDGMVKLALRDWRRSAVIAATHPSADASTAISPISKTGRFGLMCVSFFERSPP